jgi:LacI family transcriptional regulator
VKKEKPVTMGDIAKAMGVSTVTVSKVFADKDGVSEDLRERIKAKATEMNYRYNSMPKLMREGKTYNVGIIISKRFLDDVYAFYWTFYQKILLALQSKKYYGILEVVSGEDEENLKIPALIAEKKVDGLMVLGQMNKEYLKKLEKAQEPRVFMDFYNKNRNVIMADNFFGSYLITDYLIQNGHRDIIFVGSIFATESILDRYLGFCKALIEHRLDSRDRVINDRDGDGKYIDIDLPEKLPTAFVCNNDEVAGRVIKKLKTLKIEVPKDISVTGFDNFDRKAAVGHGITTMEVDVDKMAKMATDVMLKSIDGVNETVPGRYLADCKLVIKDTVRNITED